MGSDATVLSVGKATHIGLVRARNEDALASSQPDGNDRGSLFLVADGMGGHSAGNVASRMAVEQVMLHYYQLPEKGPSERLRQAVEEANREIFETAQTHMEYFRMGTTLVGTAIIGNLAHVANVGDSRLYLVRGAEIQQVTRDHSWVALQVEMGELTLEEAQVSQNRSVLLRCLGEKADVLVDILQLVLHVGDRLVLCTDGLHGLVKPELIRDVVAAHSPQEACDRLVALANAYGGHDNITVEVVLVHACPAAVVPAAASAASGAGGSVSDPPPSPPQPVAGSEASPDHSLASARATAPAAVSAPLVITPIPPPPVPANPYPYGMPAPTAPPRNGTPPPEPEPSVAGLAARIRWLGIALLVLAAVIALLLAIQRGVRRPTAPAPGSAASGLPASGAIPSPLAPLARSTSGGHGLAAVEDGILVARLRAPVVSMTADGSSLYWLEGSAPTRLRRLPVARARDRSADPASVPLPKGRFHAVAVAGPYLYLAGDHTIVRIPLDWHPGTGRVVSDIPTRAPARLLAAAGPALYWVEAEPSREPDALAAIRRTRLPAGRPAVVATTHGLITGLVARPGGAVYWAEEGSGIHEARSRTTRTVAVGSPSCLAADGWHLYWTEESGDEGADTRLRRCALTGGPPATVATLRGAVTALAVNPRNLFWVVSNGNSYSIKRLAKR